MECPVCLVNWNLVLNIPRMLQCGHSLCEYCVKQMLQKNEIELKCPICVTSYKFDSASVALSKIAKNFALLNLLEQQHKSSQMNLDKRKSNQRSFSQFKMSAEDNDQLDISADKGYHLEESNAVYVYLKESRRICPTHKERRIFYDLDANQKLRLYCNKCDQSLAQNLRVLPQIVQQMNANIRKFQAHEQKCQQIVKNVIESFPQYIQQSKNLMKNQMNSHLKKINDIIKIYKQTLERKLEEGWKQLSIHETDVLSEINQQFQMIRQQGQTIKQFKQHPDKNYIYKIFSNIEDWITDIEKFNLSEVISPIFFEIKGTQDIERQLHQQLISDNRLEFSSHTLSEIDLKLNNIDFVKGLVENDYTWVCIKCGQLNNKSLDEENKLVQCQYCKGHRSFYTNTEIMGFKTGSLSEIKKRKYECMMFELLGKTQDDQEYLIDHKWIMGWNDYIDGHSEISPQQIDNSILLMKSSEQIKNSQSMKINSYQWDFLTFLYGGGPCIPSQNSLEKQLQASAEKRGTFDDDSDDLSDREETFIIPSMPIRYNTKSSKDFSPSIQQKERIQKIQQQMEHQRNNSKYQEEVNMQQIISQIEKEKKVMRDSHSSFPVQNQAQELKHDSKTDRDLSMNRRNLFNNRIKEKQQLQEPQQQTSWNKSNTSRNMNPASSSALGYIQKNQYIPKLSNMNNHSNNNIGGGQEYYPKQGPNQILPAKDLQSFQNFGEYFNKGRK